MEPYRQPNQTTEVGDSVTLNPERWVRSNRVISKSATPTTIGDDVMRRRIIEESEWRSYHRRRNVQLNETRTVETKTAVRFAFDLEELADLLAENIGVWADIPSAEFSGKPASAVNRIRRDLEDQHGLTIEARYLAPESVLVVRAVMGAKDQA